MNKNFSKEEFIESCVNKAANGGYITYVDVCEAPYDKGKHFCYVNFLEAWFDSNKNKVSIDDVRSAIRNCKDDYHIYGLKSGAFVQSWICEK